jgi:recombination protein RecR
MNEIESLIQLISKLPGLGPRSARRATLHLIKNKNQLLVPLANTMLQTAENVVTCHECGNLYTASPCNICRDDKRDHRTICVVEEVADLWAMERGGMYKGLYHVLGGVLSAIDGVTARDLNLEKLPARAANADEIIIATNPTALGQTTAYYIMEMLQGLPLKITRLAQGLPLGAELDYMDEGTLSLALKMRQDY